MIKSAKENTGPSSKIDAPYIAALEPCLALLDGAEAAAKAKKLGDVAAPALEGFAAAAAVATSAPNNGRKTYNELEEKSLEQAKAGADLHFAWGRLATRQMGAFQEALVQVVKSGPAAARGQVFDALAATVETTKVKARTEYVMQEAYAAEQGPAQKAKMKAAMTKLGLSLTPSK